MRRIFIFAIICFCALAASCQTGADILRVKVGGTGNGTSWANAYGKIQDAITASSEDDRIWVQGYSDTTVYNECITLKNGVSIKGGYVGDNNNNTDDDLRDIGDNPTYVTTISASGLDSCVVYADGITNTEGTIIEYCTIRDGVGKLVSNYRYGCGVCCISASPTISHCRICTNYYDESGTYTYHGGGIYGDADSTPVIQNCVIVSNTSDCGGGIYLYQGICTDNNISSNRAWGQGGGASLGGSGATESTFTGNTVSSNHAVYGGGGVFLGNGSAYTVFSDNLIDSNGVIDDGGGISALGSCSILNNRITNNSAWGCGGGIFWYEGSSSGSLYNNVISGNKAYTWGKGAYISSSAHTEIVNNTIVNNTSQDGGINPCAIYLTGGTVGLYNNIIANNSTYGVYTVGQITYSYYNCLYNNGTDYNVTPVNSLGNINTSPSFETDGYHLAANSTNCIDAGYYDIVAWDTDIDTQPRVQGNNVDIGADEIDNDPPRGSIVISGSDVLYTLSTTVTLILHATDYSSGVYQMRFSNDDSTWSEWESYGSIKSWTLASGDGEKTVYVQYKDNAGNVSASFSDRIYLRVGNKVIYVNNQTGNDNNYGFTWATAKATIWRGVQAAQSGDEVWVAEGTYTITVICPTKSNIGIYGGFAGDELNRNDRDWVTHETIIDGSANYLVVDVPIEGSGSVIDGFTFRNGVPYDVGGYIWCSGSVTIAHNKVLIDEADSAIYIDAAATFHDNLVIASFLSGEPIKNGVVVGSGAQIFNNTIVNACIAYSDSGTYAVDNNIIANWGDTATITLDADSCYNNCFYGFDAADIIGVNNNFSGDPLFVDSANGDYHLSNISPCIDAGLGSVVGTGWLDIDNQPRIQGNSVDIGVDEVDNVVPVGSVLINQGDTYAQLADVVLTLTATDAVSGVSKMRFSNDGSTWSSWENYDTSWDWTLASGDGNKTVYAQFKDNAGNVSATYSDSIYLRVGEKTIYVNGQTGSDNNYGFTWASAKATVSGAISTALSGDQVWVAQGTYYGCITLPVGVKLYGGFPTTSESIPNPGLSDRDWTTNVSILDANGAASTVICNVGVTNTSVIDGFTITNATSTSGIKCTDAHPVISHNIIDINAVSGISCWGNSHPTIWGNIICDTATSASPLYGEIYDGIDINDTSSPLIVNNTIVDLPCNGIHLTNRLTVFPTIANNIIAYNSRGICSDGINTTSVLVNNLVAVNSTNYVYVTMGATDLIPYAPGFVDRSGADYHLIATSHAINGGDSSYVGEDWTDIDGESRIMGSHVDIGADEFVDFAAPTNGSIVINSGAENTESLSVTLTLSATDDYSGVYQMRFSNDGSTWSDWYSYATTKGWTLAANAAAEKTVYVQFQDKAYQISDSYSDTIVLVDITPPTGSVGISGSNGTCTLTTSVTLVLSASDSGSGVYQMRFSNDGSTWSDWESYATSKSWTLTSGEGEKIVYAQFKDYFGNVADASDAIYYRVGEKIIYVNAATGDDDNYGFTWATAKKSIYGATYQFVQSGDEIWVAAGQYSNIVSGFISVPNVAIYGGFLGSETSLDQRNWVANETEVINWGEASWGYIGLSGLVIDGFTLTDVSSRGWTSAVTMAHNKIWITEADETINLSAAVAFHDNLVITDTSQMYGETITGGVAFGSGAQIINNTLIDTKISYSGTGTYALKNNIVANLGDTSTLSLDLASCYNNCFYGFDVPGVIGSNGNFSSDPLFVYKAHYCGDYHLTYASPCIDTGLDSAVVSDLDLDKNDRQIDLAVGTSGVAVDIGAYEYPDLASPSGSIVIKNGDAYTQSTTVDLTLSATDDYSGVYQMRFSNDGSTWSSWVNYQTSSSCSLTSGDGTKTVYVQFMDNVGRVSGSFSDTIILDTTSPTGSISISNGALYATATSVTLNLSASDARSGVYQMRFSNDGSTWGNWINYATSASWSLTSGDGEKTVYAQFKDNVGNVSASYSDKIYLRVGAKTIYVNGETGGNNNYGFAWASAKATVSGAISAALSGDQIWVAQGTYEECITLPSGVKLYGGFEGTESVSTGRRYASYETILDGDGFDTSVVTIPASATSATEINGFTIRNGAGTLVGVKKYGGGIICNSSSSPVISNNKIISNITNDGGQVSDPTVVFQGAGIYCGSGCTATIINNLIAGNGMYGGTANSSVGGGINCDGCSGVLLVNNTIVRNAADHAVGVLVNNNGVMTASNNILAYNFGRPNTGGFGLYLSTGTLTTHNNCSYPESNNTHNADSSTDIKSSPGFVSFTDNTSLPVTGMDFHLVLTSLCIDAGYPSAVGTGWTDIDGDTRSLNLCVDIGADEHGYTDTTLPSAPVVSDEGVYTSSTTQLSATWTASTDTGRGLKGYEIALSEGGTENLAWTYVGNVTSYTLTGLSLNYGTIYFIAVRAVDRAGNYNTGMSDGIMPQKTVYVKTSANGGSDANNGLSWTSAKATFTGVTGALSIAPAGTIIKVAAGTYNEAIECSEVFLYGAYPSAGGETRNYTNNITTINASGIAASAVYINSDDTPWGCAVIDGFTITGGSGTDGKGGGVYADGCVSGDGYLVISNCHITCNTAENGGGIYGYGATIIDNVIDYNTVSDQYTATGAGIAFRCNGVISGNTITHNTGDSDQLGYGGGIYVSSSAIAGLTISGNLIELNTMLGDTISRGGGISMKCSGAVVADNIIAKCKAEVGAGIYSEETDCDAANNTIVNMYDENGSANNGEAVNGWFSVFFNNIIAYNGTGLNGGGSWLQTKNYFYSNDDNGDISSNDIAASVSPGLTSTYHLSSTSPCIDAGYLYWNAYIDVDYDYDGQYRENNIVDIGADEYYQ
ncbi:MAG: right-handed parallel beta-helix repeat-containing protein [Armatimonadota bacterium]|nr:right-handed parallel beta-helix repeat-containing protein [bacterium]